MSVLSESVFTVRSMISQYPVYSPCPHLSPQPPIFLCCLVPPLDLRLVQLVPNFVQPSQHYFDHPTLGQLDFLVQPLTYYTLHLIQLCLDLFSIECVAALCPMSLYSTDVGTKRLLTKRLLDKTPTDKTPTRQNAY